MSERLHIGCHLSSTKGFLYMGRQILSMGGDTFQFFTRNPRGSKAKAIDVEDAKALMSLMEENRFAKILAHAPYTLNPASADPKVREFAELTILDDLERMEYTPGQMYNFHPGSHVGQGTEEGIRLISDLLNRVMKPEQTTKVLLETMAGKGSEVGGRFEELAEIIKRVELTEKIGVCLDTCHVHDGGYDIVNNLDGVLEKFDRVVGLDRLKAIHINDSKNPLASRKDRHEVIGGGHIGLEAFTRIINHPALRDLPFFLETPNEIPGYTAEIVLLSGLYQK